MTESRIGRLGSFCLSSLPIYLPLGGFGFLNFDDPLFVTENPNVTRGITFDGIRWAFTTLNGGASYYHPLTWLSHQLDCQLFGLRSGAHHLTHLWFHLANTVLLLKVLDLLTGKIWRSAAVAALFALHPLHIESVASQLFSIHSALKNPPFFVKFGPLFVDYFLLLPQVISYNQPLPFEFRMTAEINQ
ncbi:MAG: Tetratricopeptide 2 repeat protein [Verrucomicrobiales bacterium]|nr:Tetratricopeptide 2 repeat protein [Verrucomicrobiales bacterium]